MQPLLDSPPPDITQGKTTEKIQTVSGLTNLIKVGYENRYFMKYNICHDNFIMSRFMKRKKITVFHRILYYHT